MRKVSVSDTERRSHFKLGRLSAQKEFASKSIFAGIAPLHIFVGHLGDIFSSQESNSHQPRSEGNGFEIELANVKRKAS